MGLWRMFPWKYFLPHNWHTWRQRSSPATQRPLTQEKRGPATSGPPIKIWSRRCYLATDNPAFSLSATKFALRCITLVRHPQPDRPRQPLGFVSGSYYAARNNGYTVPRAASFAGRALALAGHTARSRPSPRTHAFVAGTRPRGAGRRPSSDSPPDCAVREGLSPNLRTASDCDKLGV